MDKEKPKAETEKQAAGVKIAAIRLKGPLKVNFQIEDTLQMLRLYRKNTCVLLSKTPSITGMLNRVKNMITWGEIDAATLKLLVQKRAEKTKIDGKEVQKPFFRLTPPKGGFGRKGIKVPFSHSGAFGYRGDKINDLIRRML